MLPSLVLEMVLIPKMSNFFPSSAVTLFCSGTILAVLENFFFSRKLTEKVEIIYNQSKPLFYNYIFWSYYYDIYLWYRRQSFPNYKYLFIFKFYYVIAYIFDQIIFNSIAQEHGKSSYLMKFCGNHYFPRQTILVKHSGIPLNMK